MTRAPTRKLMPAALAIPLVPQGPSRVADEQLVAAIRAGMTRINVSTHLSGFVTAAVRQYLTDDRAVVGSRTYISAARSAVAGGTARLPALFALAPESPITPIPPNPPNPPISPRRP
jgi:fructose-bisphosphate aldolase, class II